MGNLGQELFDPVNKPAHYADKEIEVIDYIKDTLTAEQFEGYCIGNVLKYASRYRLKGGVQDLEKAGYYLAAIIRELAPTYPQSPMDADIEEHLLKPNRMCENCRHLKEEFYSGEGFCFKHEKRMFPNDTCDEWEAE